MLICLTMRRRLYIIPSVLGHRPNESHTAACSRSLFRKLRCWMEWWVYPQIPIILSRGQRNWYFFGLSPHPSNSGKWRFIGIPYKKNVIILVVTGILGRGDNPRYFSGSFQNSVNWERDTQNSLTSLSRSFRHFRLLPHGQLLRMGHSSSMAKPPVEPFLSWDDDWSSQPKSDHTRYVVAWKKSIRLKDGISSKRNLPENVSVICHVYVMPGCHLKNQRALQLDGYCACQKNWKRKPCSLLYSYLELRDNFQAQKKTAKHFLKPLAAS